MPKGMEQKAQPVKEAKTVLMLSAGAPHSPLMAGALCALYKHKKKFDIIYTSGAGALVGLLFVAPKDKSPDRALEGLVELGVSDLIYRFLPVNYKAFFKPGPFTQPIHRFAQHFKLGTFEPKTRTNAAAPSTLATATVDTVIDAIGEAIETGLGRRVDRFRRLYNDLVDLWAAAITPTTLNYWSKGVCQPLPFLEDLVDFGKLGKFGGDFYINAFSPDKAREFKPEVGKSGTGSGMELFAKEDIGPDQVRAAFAYPFIYPPVKIDGRLYFEGADRDPIGFGNLLSIFGLKIDDKGNLISSQRIGKITIVLIDILASLSEYLLREPRNLWDAFGISIMVPVVAHALNEVARFERVIQRHQKPSRAKPTHPKIKLLQLKFGKIPEDVGPHITDWSYSNMSTLFEIGRKAGKEFFDSHEHDIWP